MLLPPRSFCVSLAKVGRLNVTILRSVFLAGRHPTRRDRLCKKEGEIGTFTAVVCNLFLQIRVFYQVCRKRCQVYQSPRSFCVLLVKKLVSNKTILRSKAGAGPYPTEWARVYKRVQNGTLQRPSPVNTGALRCTHPPKRQVPSRPCARAGPGALPGGLVGNRGLYILFHIMQAPTRHPAVQPSRPRPR